jgi:HEAT repeat protein
MRKATGIVTALLVLVLSANAADISNLITQMKAKDPDVRRQAAKELAEAGADAKPAVTVLSNALKDSDLFVRRFSAQALGNIGPDAAPAIPALRTALLNSRENKEVQEAAAAALGKMGKGGVEALIAVLKDSNKEPDVRRKAVESLGLIGPDAKSAIKPLVEALQGGTGTPKKGPVNNADIRTDICTALGEIATAKDEAAIKALQMVSGDKQNKKNKNLKSSATDALRKIKDRK